MLRRSAVCLFSQLASKTFKPNINTADIHTHTHHRHPQATREALPHRLSNLFLSGSTLKHPHPSLVFQRRPGFRTYQGLTLVQVPRHAVCAQRLCRCFVPQPYQGCWIGCVQYSMVFGCISSLQKSNLSTILILKHRSSTNMSVITCNHRAFTFVLFCLAVWAVWGHGVTGHTRTTGKDTGDSPCS